MRRSAVNRHVFTENVVVADLDARGLPVVFHVLWAFTQNGTCENHVATAHCQGTAHVNVWTENTSGADANLSLDQAVGPNLDIIGKLRLDNGGRRC